MFQTEFSGRVLAGLAFSCSVFLAGCTGKDGDYQTYQDAETAPASEHDHDHGHPGVNGGHVIELSDNHSYHAEMVFDKATRNITLYFYGAKVGEAKPATGVVFELKQGTNELVLEAKPSPLDGEAADKASRYVVSGENLPKEITSEEQLEGHFHVTLDGMEYEGGFHAHSHDEHAQGVHAHGEHAHADDKGKDGDHAHEHKDEKAAENK